MEISLINQLFNEACQAHLEKDWSKLREIYKKNGFHYETDEHGRIADVDYYINALKERHNFDFFVHLSLILAAEDYYKETGEFLYE